MSPINNGTLKTFFSSFVIYSIVFTFNSIAQSGWNLTNSGTTLDLYSVCFVDDSTGWAVGDSGIIIKTSDSGSSWNVDFPTSARIVQQLNCVHFPDANNGWAVGVKPAPFTTARVLKTTDAGTQWIDVTKGSIPACRSCYFTSADTGWIVTRFGYIIHTTDGGQTLNEQASNVSFDLRSVFFTNVSTGWVVGTGDTILHTTDGGENWLPQATGTPSLRSVYFINSDTGWAVGLNGVILSTTDGGENWFSQTSNVSVLLNDIHFINETTGWIVGANGIILKTIDGGTTWGQQLSNTSVALQSVCMIDDQTGFATGLNGTILFTKDGGGEIINALKQSVLKIPKSIRLYQNYPNPFNPTTMINYQLPMTGSVELSIFNLLGQKVTTLVNERKRAGHHKVEWDASGYSSGIYLYQLKAGKFQDMKKMILIK